jgi:hypothetical protein
MRDSVITTAFPSARFCQVLDSDELIFRIKESEIVVGQVGRVFYLGQLEFIECWHVGTKRTRVECQLIRYTNQGFQGKSSGR